MMDTSSSTSSSSSSDPTSAAARKSGPAIRVKEISQLDDRILSITWTDHRRDLFDVVQLRRKCPCATCIDEWTHEQILKPEQISEDVRPLKVDSVGQYALTLQFSDGHKTGIYTFNLLRGLAKAQIQN